MGRKMKKYLRVGLTLLLAITLASCSKAPEMEMNAAQAALDAARAAQADMYDPATCRMASDTLNAAMAAKTEQDGKSGLSRKYDDARAMFVRAKELADQSAAQAAINMESMRAEVTAMLPVVKADIEAAKGKIPAKSSKSEIEGWKNMLAAAEADIAAADSEFNAGNIMSAKARLQIAMKTAMMVTAQITAGGEPKATAKTTAAPAKKIAKKR